MKPKFFCGPTGLWLVALLLSLCPHVVLAGDNNERHINGVIADEPMAPGAVIFLSHGPTLSKTEMQLQLSRLPTNSSGAYYRVGLLATEMYTDIFVELVAIGPEEWRKVVLTRLLYGQDIAHAIGNDHALNFELTRWIDARTIQVKAPNKTGSIEFQLRIKDDGSVDLSH